MQECNCSVSMGMHLPLGGSRNMRWGGNGRLVSDTISPPGQLLSPLHHTAEGSRIPEAKHPHPSPPAEAGTDGSAPSQGSRGSSPVGHICSHPASLCSAWLLSFLCIQHICVWLYVVTSAQSPAWDFPAAGTAIPVL